MNISYVTTYDAKDVNNWSGTGTYIAKSLESENAKIEYIGNLKFESNFSSRLKSIFYSRILKKGYFPERTLYTANNYAKQIENSLKLSTDLVFSPGSIPIAFLETKKPKVFYTDATFAGMLNLYESFSNLSREAINDGNNLEQVALNTSSLCIYSSDWAAESAIKNYSVSPEKIKVVPFGANIECKRTLSDVKEIIKLRSGKKCQLLFLGVDWKRKSGDLVIEVARQLNENGVETDLHIAGIDEIPTSSLPGFVKNHGFISKSTKAGRDILDQLIARSHFLIVPSVAEAYGIVFCEANSFGVPCISTNVGGIPTIIKDDINGKKFTLLSGAKEYAGYIQSMFSDYTKYEQFAYSSFNEYEKRLNWKAAGISLMKLLKDL